MQRHKLGEMPIFKGIEGNVNNVNNVNIHQSHNVVKCRITYFVKKWKGFQKIRLYEQKIHKTLLKVINKILWNVNKLISKKMFTYFNNISGTHCY